MKKISDLVKRKDWQDLRESLKGHWSEHPEDCIRKLRSWLGNIKTTEEDKLRIVMNYLVGSGFRLGRIKHPSIQKLRTEISVELRRRKYL